MDFNLTLSPSQLEFVAKPGASITQAYQVTNNSNHPVSLSASVDPWLPQGDAGLITYCQPDCPAHYSDYSFSLNNADLQLNQPFLLQPHQSTQLVLKIKVSPQANLADYYGTFFLNQIDPLSSPTDSASHSLGRLGSHLLLSASPQSSFSLQANISRFQLTPRLKDIFFTPLHFQGQVSNQSPHFFALSGNITLTKNGQNFRQLKLAPQNVLAFNSRSLQCLSSDTPPKIIPCQLQPPFWPGLYQATLNLDTPIQATPFSLNFYVLPFTPILLLISATLLSSFLLRLKKRLSSP